MSRSQRLGRRFWTVWSAGTASNIGDGIVLAAFPLLAATLTRDPLAVALTTAAARLPWLLFGSFAGVIADRVDRLRLMIVADVARAVAFAAIAVVVATDNMTIPVLYAAAFGVGILETLFDTPAMSLTPSLVRKHQLDLANARINGAQIAANEFLGPPLGAALFAGAAALPFGVDAATFAVSATILLTVPGRYRPERDQKRSIRGDIAQGFRFLWQEPLIRAFAIGAGVINFGFTAASAVLVLHAQDNLSLGDFEFGLLLAAGAAGGILGAAASPRAIISLGRRKGVLGSVVAISVGVATMGLADSWWGAAAGIALVGFAGAIWNVISVTYRQSVTPDQLLGRIMSSFRVIAYGAFPLGAAAGGAIASIAGLRSTFLVGAGVIAALVPYLVRVTARHLKSDA